MFSQLAKDALAHSKEENGERSTHELSLKLAIIGEAFDHRAVEGISKQDIQNWLMEQAQEREWSPATRNTYQAAFSPVFRVGMDNEKITFHPAARIKRKAKHNDRIRFLSETEEQKLTVVLRESWPHYLPAFLVSIPHGDAGGAAIRSGMACHVAGKENDHPSQNQAGEDAPYPIERGRTLRTPRTQSPI